LVTRPPPRPPRTLAWRLSRTWAAIRDSARDFILHPPEAVPPEPPPEVRAPWGRMVDEVVVEGVVHSTVLNPGDGRKNWRDILTAFCWAFREVEDATLVIKFSHPDQIYYQVMFMTYLSRIEPFRCRVIGIFGFLDDAAYASLLRASTFSVNASSGEGLCLPLMEAMCAAKPVVAPDHTAMADYVDGEVGFIVAGRPQRICWPHDLSGKLLTNSLRLNWESLMVALRCSRQTAIAEPGVYKAMSAAARERMRNYASVEKAASVLGPFLRHACERRQRLGQGRA
jgi:glycosyltransferase involved in cell wall biosynthesis